jgi:hypothetical protein
MAGAFLSLRRVLPHRYALAEDVETYIADEQRLGRLLDYAVILPADATGVRVLGSAAVEESRRVVGSAAVLDSAGVSGSAGVIASGAASPSLPSRDRRAVRVIAVSARGL